MNKEELKQKALDFIHLKDLEIGSEWSDTDDGIADVLSEFADQYATTQTEALKKEIEELRAEIDRLNGIIEANEWMDEDPLI